MPYGLNPDILDKIYAVLVQFKGIEKVILFGSRAKGNFKEGSDIDIALSAPAYTLQDLQNIAIALDDINLPWKIDIQLLHYIHEKALLDHIYRKGIVLYE